ncbi:hypothetical protein [Nonomuraea dietziae]|uniref:hypothetical protein n=1 Tax=Nonomuraea dietziae TaxID=65515 RepID=UPI0031E39D34
MNIQSLDSDLRPQRLRMERPLPHPTCTRCGGRLTDRRTVLARWFPADLRIDDPMPGGKVVFDLGAYSRRLPTTCQ